jgi:CDP-glucose 4,6-dehydratase
MLELLRETYKGKKVFVTGHTGFKGAWLLKILDLLGAQVGGYALEPQGELNLYTVLQGDSLCDSVIGDLRDRPKLSKAMETFNPDFVFHLAAQPLVRLSYEIPSETFEVNAIGTANVLDALRKQDKRCNVVLITTDKVYQNNEWHYPYRESDRLGGYDPYSASKACTELVIESYKKSFFNNNNFQLHQKAVAVGRAGNVIGGGDWAVDRLLPDIVRALAANKTVEIRNPDSVRPWQHVLEPLSGYLLLGSNLSYDHVLYGQSFNFGPEAADALPVNEMVRLALKSWGSGSVTVSRSDKQPYEAGLLKLDISKAMAVLKWRPKMNASMAVQKTIEWYKSFYSDVDKINQFTEIQIKDFFNG